MKKTLFAVFVVLLTVTVCACFVGCSLFGGDSVGIKSIEKTGTEGLVDTYTITMTDGTTSTFTVTNGKDGSDASGVTSGSGTSSGATATYTPDEYFRFKLLEDGTYEVGARYNDMPNCVVIPSTYNGKAVTKISDFGFNQDNLRAGTDKYIIPEGITHIGDYAFQCNQYTTEIVLPSTLVSIGNRVFTYCDNLVGKEYNGGYYLGSEKNPYMVLIGLKIDSITGFTFPNGIVAIKENAFMNCKLLTLVSIPKTVTVIEPGIFRGCSALTSVTIDKTVKEIYGSAFEDCTSLESIIYQGTKAEWDRIEMISSYYLQGKTIQCSDTTFIYRGY